jgi:hypothetical protein
MELGANPVSTLIGTVIYFLMVMWPERESKTLGSYAFTVRCEFEQMSSKYGYKRGLLLAAIRETSSKQITRKDMQFT